MTPVILLPGRISGSAVSDGPGPPSSFVDRDDLREAVFGEQVIDGLPQQVLQRLLALCAVSRNASVAVQAKADLKRSGEG